VVFILPASAQVDEESFFDGTYDKAYIKKHKIKTIISYPSLDTTRFLPRIFYFDRNGILQKEKSIDSSGKEIITSSNFYNSYGHLIRKIIYPTKEYRGDTISYTREYKDGRMIKYISSTFPIPFTYTYNRQGQLLEVTNPYNNAYIQLSRRVVRNEYDSAGRLIRITERILRAASDTVEQHMSDRTLIYKGNRIQRIVERVKNGEFPTNKGNITYMYDHKGNVTGIESDIVTSRYYIYDNTGLLICKRRKLPADLVPLDARIDLTIYQYTFWK
jgi:hypothetical protein